MILPIFARSGVWVAFNLMDYHEMMKLPHFQLFYAAYFLHTYVYSVSHDAPFLETCRGKVNT